MRVFSTLVGIVCFVSILPASEWGAKEQTGQAAMQQHDFKTAGDIFLANMSQATTEIERTSALASYGVALAGQKRNAEAKTALENALRNPESLSDQNRTTVTRMLSSIDRSLGDYAGAERLLRTAVADSSLHANERASLMVKLIDLLREQGRLPEAESVLSDATQLTGLSHEAQTSILVERAEVTRDLHQWNESVALWRDIGDIAQTDRSDSLEVIYTGGLGETYFTMGNTARAEPLLRRSLDLLRKNPDASAAQVATALSLMACLYMAENKLTMAGDALEDAIVRDEDAFGPAHPQVATLLELEATVESRRGDAQDARAHLSQARTIMAEHFGPDSLPVAGVAATLGQVEQRDHHPGAAAAQYKTALDLIREAGADGMKFTATILAQYTAVLKAMHKSDKANALLAR